MEEKDRINGMKKQKELILPIVVKYGGRLIKIVVGLMAVVVSRIRAAGEPRAVMG